MRFEVEDQLGWRPLHRAVSSGLTRATALLLQRHADVTAADRDGCQPLHVAVCAKQWACCRLLLEASADPTVPDGLSGMTAQMFISFAEGDRDGLAELRSLVGAPAIVSGEDLLADDSEDGEDAEADAAGDMEAAEADVATAS